MLTLHPASGVLGGAVFLLTSWIIPDLFWISLGVVITFAFKKLRPLLKIFIVILVYLSSAIPVLIIQSPLIQPQLDFKIITIDEQLSSWITTTGKDHLLKDVILTQKWPRPEVRSDEGCMCMYWAPVKTLEGISQKYHYQTYRQQNGSYLFTEGKINSKALIVSDVPTELIEPGRIKEKSKGLIPLYWERVVLQFIHSTYPALFVAEKYSSPLEVFIINNLNTQF